MIALAKIGRLKMLKDLYGTVVISGFVKVESVDRGKELGATDALEIERAINEGWIKVADLTGRQNKTVQRLVSEARVGLGEAEALTIARDEKIPIILDDKEDRALAKSWDLELTSIVMVLYEAFIKNLISYDELVEDLAKLTRVMWISTDVIIEVIKRAKKVVK
jgi:predicted nucleic acid-binding protein